MPIKEYTKLVVECDAEGCQRSLAAHSHTEISKKAMGHGWYISDVDSQQVCLCAEHLAELAGELYYADEPEEPAKPAGFVLPLNVEVNTPTLVNVEPDP